MSKEISGVTNKEPLMHISKRDGIETWKSWLIRIIAVLLSLVVCAGVIVALTGLNPIEVYKGRRPGADRRCYFRSYDDLSGKFPSSSGIIPSYVPWQCSSSHDLGRDPGLFQGLLEYQ